MGAFDETDGAPVQEAQIPATDTIEIGQGNYVVVARTEVTPDDEQWVINQLLTSMTNQGRKQMTQAQQLQLADRLWLERLIISWTLPIPLDPDRAKAIRSLSQLDRDYLYKTIMAAQPKKKERRALGMKGPSPALKQALQKRAKRFSLLNT